MKKTLLLILVLQLAVILGFSQEWQTTYQDDSKGTWTALHFINASVGYAGNSYGLICVTEDAGQNWTEIYSASGHVKNFSFPNDSVAVVAIDGYNPTHIAIDLKTKKVLWEDTEYSTALLKKVHSIDGYRGVSISNLKYREDLTTSIYSYKRYIQKTNDGGKSWTKVKDISIDSYNEYFVDLAFATGDTGIVVAQNRTLYRTTDGGTTWVQKDLMNGELNKAAFCNDSCGIIIGDNGVVWYSYDSGLKWYNKSISTDLNLEQVTVVNDSTYIVTTNTDDWKAYKSIDCGQTWTEITTVAETKPVPSSFEVLDNIVFMGSETGILVKTTQEFASMDTLYGKKIHGAFRSIHFSDKNTGWAVGVKSLLCTKDGGKTWSSAAITECANDVFAINNSTVFVACNDGVILKSTDGGVTWESSTHGKKDLNSISFHGAFGVAVGDYGVIYVTKDTGLTWEDQISVPKQTCNDVQVVNDSLVFIVGENGLILRSGDTCNTWKATKIDKYDDMYRLSFINEKVGYAVADNTCGNNYHFIKTTDGGQTWVNMPNNGIEKEDDFDIVNFVSEKEGWLGGISEILHTADNAQTWDTTKTGKVIAIQAINEKNVYALISNNKILKFSLPTENFTITFNVKDISGNVIENPIIIVNSTTLEMNTMTFTGEEDIEYTYKVGKTAYIDAEGSLTLTKDTTINIVLEVAPPKKFDITFTVKNISGNAIENPIIIVNSTTLEMNTMTFTGEENIEYSYKISKTAYINAVGSLTLTKDTTINIVLNVGTSKEFTITFNVINTLENKINDPYIIVNSETINSMSFTGEENDLINYKVGKTGYSEVEGNITLVKDETINVVLKEVETSIVNSLSAINSKIYPNPASDFVKISSDVAGFNINIYNVIGQLVLNQLENGKQSIVNIASLKNGLYFIKVQQNGVESIQKLIKK
ncbi:MAG: T9SS type A sorting domain-containing protein [Bacteroidetes bacterium]|nr:T9SS type A sorting domain-containing protein [Bacteroidota bacterium]